MLGSLYNRKRNLHSLRVLTQWIIPVLPMQIIDSSDQGYISATLSEICQSVSDRRRGNIEGANRKSSWRGLNKILDLLAVNY